MWWGRGTWQRRCEGSITDYWSNKWLVVHQYNIYIQVSHLFKNIVFYKMWCIYMSLFKRKWCTFLYLSLQDHFLTLQFIIKVLLVYQFHLHHFKLQHKNPPYSIIKLNIYFSGLKKTPQSLNSFGSKSFFFGLAMELKIKVSLKISSTLCCRTKRPWGEIASYQIPQPG